MNRYGQSLTFKETLRAEAKGYYKLKKQTGGPGQFAIVELVARPLPRDGGFRFASSVVGGRIPSGFIPAVEKGVREALAKGVLGYPVVDVAVELTDGKHHKRDSHARDFQVAGAMAFREALRCSRPVLLEPFGELEVLCPTPSLGFVLGQLGARRARVRGTDYRNERYVVQAEVPLIEMPGFESELQTATSGLGRCSLTAGPYDIAPEAVLARLAGQ